MKSKPTIRLTAVESASMKFHLKIASSVVSKISSSAFGNRIKKSVVAFSRTISQKFHEIFMQNTKNSFD